MIWIIGSEGMLGKELCEVLKESNVPFVGTDKDVSILEPDGFYILNMYLVLDKNAAICYYLAA